MIDPTDFRECVIDPTLRAMDMWSPEASDLVLGTALVESGLKWLRQKGGGPALGLYQMEPATEKSLLRYVDRRSLGNEEWQDLEDYIRSMSYLEADPLTTNLCYATAMARLKYYRKPAPIPENTRGQAGYWSRWYNTPLGKGTPDKYLEAWEAAGLTVKV